MRRPEDLNRFGGVVTAAGGLALGAITGWLSVGFNGLFPVLLPVLALGFGLMTSTRIAMTGTAGLLVGNAIWLGWPFPNPEVFLATMVGIIFGGGIAIFVVAAAAGLLRTKRSAVRYGIPGVVFLAFLAWTLFLLKSRHRPRRDLQTARRVRTFLLMNRKRRGSAAGGSLVCSSGS